LTETLIGGRSKSPSNLVRLKDVGAHLPVSTQKVPSHLYSPPVHEPQHRRPAPSTPSPTLAPMEEQPLDEVRDHLSRALGLNDQLHVDRSSEGLVHHALRALPQPGAWHCLADEGGGAIPRALLLVGDRLVEIWATRDGGDGMARLRSLSRPLADSGVVIELDFGDRTTTDESVSYRTTWTFKFPGGDEVPVRGRVRTMPDEELDDAEEFARAVAAQVGNVVVSS